MTVEGQSVDTRRLLLRMHRGDGPAAERLWALFAGRLVGYARVVLPRGFGVDAEDVVQSVFVAVLTQQRRDLRAVRDVEAYLFKVTRNRALNYARSELREQARRMASSEQSRGDWFGARTERVLRAAEGLTYEQREVVLLRYVGGLTLEQISDALGLNRNTVASRGRLGIARLRELVDDGAELWEVHDES